MLIKQKKKGKKAVSVVIGYVLLVVFAIVISAGVYAWLKTYVPSEPLNCPDGVSLFIKDARFNSSTSKLNVTVRNNGRFDVAGYFIHATNSSTQELPSIDLSSYLVEDSEGIKFGNSVLHSVTGTNSLKPGEERRNSFNIPSAVGNIYSIRIIPTKFQEENNRERFVSCGDSRVQQIVGAPNAAGGACVPNCAGKICGSDGCGGSCPPNNCGGGSSCNAATGQCVAGVVCGDGNIGGTEQCDGANLNGKSCTTQGFTGGTLSCNSGCQFNTSQCTTTIGNGVCDSGETCAQEPTACQGLQATCSSGNICISGSCQPISGGVGCTNYCVSLSTPYTTSTCVGPPGQCNSQYGGTLQSGGDQYCQSGTPKCCCIP